MAKQGPKFFVPGLEKAADAEKVYEATAKYNKVAVPKKHSDRICSLAWTRNGNKYYAEVGFPLEEIYGGETVMAILKDGERYYICTPNSGVLGGFPIIVNPNNLPVFMRFSD